MKFRSLLLTFFLVSLPAGQQVRSQTTGDCVELQTNVIVDDCVCDPSCDTCFYYGVAVNGPEDCRTCPDGFIFNGLFDDGSGTCTADPATTDPATEAPTGPSPTSSPDNATDGPASTPGGICVMVYQLADNNLESDIRGDLSEMTKSALTLSVFTTTWVYHDALNEGDPNYTGGPLADVFNSDGTPLTERFDGSRYLMWDHDLGKMVVDTEFSTELNSDSSAVLQAFVEYALADCVAKGTIEFFLALSSHGGGFVGFGGDENLSRHRKLLQSNSDIYSAIQGALSSVPGAPTQLDVLGFDACLMQSMGAIDDFAGIAKYYLASEAVEPGHGWAYNELSATTSAVDLAVNIVETFASSLQGYSYHQTPKTLSVVDTTAFLTFRDAWDAMCAEMLDILDSGNDADFHANLHRARGSTQGFEGYLDSPLIQVKAAMDIGDFIATFLKLCVPEQSSQLYALMINADEAYKTMFVANEFGPGTSGTGMHITWVSKQEYLADVTGYDSSWFAGAPIMGAPNYWSLLESFYFTSTPTVNVGTSVCGTSTSPSRSAAAPSELLIDPSLVFVDNVTSEIRSEITQNVDFVFVEYGIDVTYLLADDGMRRRLDESARCQKARRLKVPEGAKTPRSSRRPTTMKWRYRDATDRTRRLQQDARFGTEDYFLIFGGDVFVDHNGPNIVASWDSTFYWIRSGADYEPVYAYDGGGGRKSIPVCYFDQTNPVTSDQIAIGVTVEDAITTLGCEEGFLSFSIAEDSDPQIGLYVYRGYVLSQVPVGAGRNIVPISYIEYRVGDEFVNELLGGFTSVIIPWTAESNITVYALEDSDNLDLFGSDTAFMQIFAYDEDANITDTNIFPYSIDNSSDSSPTPNAGNNSSDSSPTPNPGIDPAAANPSSAGKMSLQVGTCITALISTCVFGWMMIL